ncbi:MAG TPA: DUF819 family protein [Acidimicrobiia bacterium]|nr:DUF819 family protein [Acidimicrobiia bacterium]
MVRREEGALPGMVLLGIIFIGFPALARWGAARWRPLEWLSPIVMAYLIGIAIGNLFEVDTDFSTSVSEAMVLLAIPLLLFSTDVRNWLRIARPAMISFGLAAASVMAVSGVAAYLLADGHAETWKMAGMTVGVYTGGTPNMSAIGVAVEVTDETFVLMNGADVVLSAVYLLFLMTVARRVLSRFLPAFDGSDVSGREVEDRSGFGIREVSISLGLAVVIGGIVAGLVAVVSGELPVAPVILGITTLGLAASFVPRIRSLPGTYETGEYLLLVFAVAIGTLADVRELAGSFSDVFVFVAIVLVASILLHYLLARLFRIDTDTVLITSTAAVFGPAFVGPVAAAIGNRAVIVSGLAAGVMGYAIGNYAGLAVAYLLQP